MRNQGRYIKNDFTKFLLDKNGHLIDVFEPKEPYGKLKGVIESYLIKDRPEEIDSLFAKNGLRVEDSKAAGIHLKSKDGHALKGSTYQVSGNNQFQNSNDENFIDQEESLSLLK